MSLRRLTCLSLPAAALVAGCATKPAPAPRVEPVQIRPVPPPAPPTPPAPAADWRDLPLTPGDWTYRSAGEGSTAGYGALDASSSFSLTCDARSRQLRLTRPRGGGALTIRTTYGERSLGASGAATLGADDPLLDEMAFSRGRFIVESAGQPMLVLPAWPEAARVVEDCRG